MYSELTVLGSGISGIAAAMTATYEGIITTIIGDIRQSRFYTDDLVIDLSMVDKNYTDILGLENNVIAGREFLNAMLQVAGDIGVTFERTEAAQIRYSGNYVIDLIDGSEIECTAVVIAMGPPKRNDLLPYIEGASQFTGGLGVSTTPLLDHQFYSGQKIALYGSGLASAYAVKVLGSVASKVYWISPSAPTEEQMVVLGGKNNVIRILSGRTVSRAVGDRILRSIVLDNGDMLNVSALFVSQGSIGLDQLGASIGLYRNDHGLLPANVAQETNLEGVFASGAATIAGCGPIEDIKSGIGAGESAAAYIKSCRERGEDGQ